MHNATLGPAAGGCRLYRYRGIDSTLTDVRHLSDAMFYKNAPQGCQLAAARLRSSPILAARQSNFSNHSYARYTLFRALPDRRGCRREARLRRGTRSGTMLRLRTDGGSQRLGRPIPVCRRNRAGRPARWSRTGPLGFARVSRRDPGRYGARRHCLKSSSSCMAQACVASVSVVARPVSDGPRALERVFEQGCGAIHAVDEFSVGHRQEQCHHEPEVDYEQQPEH